VRTRTIVEADHVILTVSLGVLKSLSGSLFTPPLPHRKLKTISALGFGVMDKILLRFKFWVLGLG
jgi:spermine oxidase